MIMYRNPIIRLVYYERDNICIGNVTPNPFICYLLDLFTKLMTCLLSRILMLK